MNRARIVGLILSGAAVCLLLSLAAGCGERPKQVVQAKDTKETKETPETKNTSETGKTPPTKKDDSEEAEIRAERAKLSPEDRKLADAQEWCANQVDERLGSMGVPLKVMVKEKEGKDHTVFVCCKNCQKDVLADPAKTLATVEELKAKKRAEAEKK